MVPATQSLLKVIFTLPLVIYMVVMEVRILTYQIFVASFFVVGTTAQVWIPMLLVAPMQAVVVLGIIKERSKLMQVGRTYMISRTPTLLPTLTLWRTPMI
jgi:hypothetical protein